MSVIQSFYVRPWQDGFKCIICVFAALVNLYTCAYSGSNGIYQNLI